MSRCTQGTLAHELAQEQGGDDGPGLPGRADVLHVGHLGVDVRPVVVGQRQRPVGSPARVAGPATRSISPSSLPIRPATLAERHHDGAGQRGQVDDGVGLARPARHSASASTSRPSASVFNTSMVLPFGW